MAASTVLKTSKLSILESPTRQSVTSTETAQLTRCQVKWRQGKLVVELANDRAGESLPALHN
ncbi:MAG: hypothetical protein AAFW84_28985 [Cyanobacteria bacterium J06635_15]